MIRRLTYAILATLIVLAPAHAQQSLTDRVSALESDVAAIKVKLGTPTAQPAPAQQPDTSAPAPATKPTTKAISVATSADIRKAVAAGAKLLQATQAIKIVDDLDLGGATLTEAPGMASGNAMLDFWGKGTAKNGTIDCPNRTAIWANGQNTVTDITVKSGARQVFDVARNAQLNAYGLVGGDTDQYGGYVESGGVLVMGSSPTRRSELHNAKHQGLLRGADAKSITVDDAILDDSGGGNAAVRGSSDQWTLRNCIIGGRVGPNPLDGLDGGPMHGGDRWVINGSLWQLPDDGRRMPAQKLFAQLIATKVPLADAVRTTFKTLVIGVERAKLGRANGLTDADVAATLAARANLLAERSTFVIQGGEIRGDFRLAARQIGKVTEVKFTGGTSLFTDDQTDFPPASLTAPGEAQPGPQISFEGCTFATPPSIDFAKYSGVKIK